MSTRNGTLVKHILTVAHMFRVYRVQVSRFRGRVA